ncbi:peptide chain release factor N(5)-glutamine methyltransferase, partial [Candidatus Peregrinibacteria bacterium]|nr:peptide chain release factor N(5)-glutamine methyltransferase [Candidatus Peregrinibacteria bacterium]
MMIQEAILWGYEQLTPTSDSPRVDAELLLAHVLKKSTTFLFTHEKERLDRSRCWPLNEWHFRRLIQKRKRGVPVAYLVGHKEFYALDFKVNHSVLVPRPDTEILAECVIEYVRGLRSQNSGLSLLLVDVGTGSGCIPISVLKNVPGLNAVATDISRSALSVAKENAKRHSVSRRIRFFKSDLLNQVPAEILKGHAVILTANLPYLPDKMEVKPELGFEP